jgi:DDE superfamily endonuclease
MHVFGQMHVQKTFLFQMANIILRTLAILHAKNSSPKTFLFQMANIILQTLAILHAKNSSPHTKMYAITLLNGVVLVQGMNSYHNIYIICWIYNRPTTKEELFNLRHASVRNVIECIFGVLKHCFRILHLAPEYNMDIQARILVSLAALHNFIHIHDPKEGPIIGSDSYHSTHSADDAKEHGDNIAPVLQDGYKRLTNAETRLQKQCGLTTSASARREEVTLMIHLML